MTDLGPPYTTAHAGPIQGPVTFDAAANLKMNEDETFWLRTLSIFYKRQPENVTRVSLKFFKNLPRSVSKSVS